MQAPGTPSPTSLRKEIARAKLERRNSAAKLGSLRSSSPAAAVSEDEIQKHLSDIRRKVRYSHAAHSGDTETILGAAASAGSDSAAGAGSAIGTPGGIGGSRGIGGISGAGAGGMGGGRGGAGYLALQVGDDDWEPRFWVLDFGAAKLTSHSHHAAGAVQRSEHQLGRGCSVDIPARGAPGEVGPSKMRPTYLSIEFPAPGEEEGEEEGEGEKEGGDGSSQSQPPPPLVLSAENSVVRERWVSVGGTGGGGGGGADGAENEGRARERCHPSLLAPPALFSYRRGALAVWVLVHMRQE